MFSYITSFWSNFSPLKRQAFIIALLLVGFGIYFFSERSSEKEGSLESWAEYFASIVYSCDNNDDCMLKDIHSPSGCYPACTNRNAKVDTELDKRNAEMSNLCEDFVSRSAKRCECINLLCK